MTSKHNFSESLSPKWNCGTFFKTERRCWYEFLSDMVLMPTGKSKFDFQRLRQIEEDSFRMSPRNLEHTRKQLARSLSSSKKQRICSIN